MEERGTFTYVKMYLTAATSRELGKDEVNIRVLIFPSIKDFISEIILF